MAEAILCGVAQTIIENLGSAAFEKFGPLWNVKDDIESIKNTVSRIQAVLLDAMEQPNRNHQASDWLEKLKDAFYDADDLLGEYKFHIELALQQEETSGNTAGKLNFGESFVEYALLGWWSTKGSIWSAVGIISFMITLLQED